MCGRNKTATRLRHKGKASQPCAPYSYGWEHGHTSMQRELRAIQKLEPQPDLAAVGAPNTLLFMEHVGYAT